MFKNIHNININLKIGIGIAGLIAIIIISGTFQVTQFSSLQRLNKSMDKRIKDAIFISKNLRITSKTKHLLSLAYIKPGNEIQALWEDEKHFVQMSLDSIQTLMDTPEETQWSKEAILYFNAYAVIFEQEILSPLATETIELSYTSDSVGNSNQNISKLPYDIFEKADTMLNRCDQNLTSIFDSLNKESELAQKDYKNSQKRAVILLIITIVCGIIYGYIILQLFNIHFLSPIKDIIQTLKQYINGNYSRKISIVNQDEIGQIAQNLNQIAQNLNITSDFAKEIEKGNFTSEFKPLSDEDVLGNTLLQMRATFKETQEKEEIRKAEDEKRNWINQGIAKFSDILRQNANNLKELSHSIIKNVVVYLNANQGGLFILNDDNKENPFLELMSAFAYNRERHFRRRINVGEGLIGACMLEMETVHLTEIPEDYIEITSGLGTANPQSLLIVPLRLENSVLGVVEIATFSKFTSYDIEFVEKIAENIASTISSAKINARTALLLEQSRQQAEEMAAQEEEMRQNMEELQATQEEADRQSVVLKGTFEAINTTLGSAEFDLNGVFQDANEFLFSRFEISREALIGRQHKDFLSREASQSDEYRNFWHKLSNGTTIVGETSYISNGGKEIWFQETFKPMKDNHGTVLKVFAIFIDVTEVKRQRSEIENQTIRLQKNQEEMHKRNQEIETMNEKLKINEQVLKKALERSKETEKEISRRNEEMKAKEIDLQNNIKELQHLKDEMENKQFDLENSNKKMAANESVLLKALEKSKEIETAYQTAITELDEVKKMNEELLDENKKQKDELLNIDEHNKLFEQNQAKNIERIILEKDQLNLEIRQLQDKVEQMQLKMKEKEDEYSNEIENLYVENKELQEKIEELNEQLGI